MIEVVRSLEASEWKVESVEDFEGKPEDEWDRFVAANTGFPDWESMLSLAIERYTLRHLGLGE